MDNNFLFLCVLQVTLAYEKYSAIYVCSDRILTCRIKSICSPVKVGLVVTDLITNPVVSWEGWETPPPPPPAPRLSCHFFAQPPAWEDLSAPVVTC